MERIDMVDEWVEHRLGMCCWSDIVVAINEHDVDTLVAAFESDFYIADAACTAVFSDHMFNLMHLESEVKVDLIVFWSSQFRLVEFARRQAIAIAGTTLLNELMS